MDHKLSTNIKVMNFIMTCFMVFYHCGSLTDPNPISRLSENLDLLFSGFFNNMGTFVMCYFFTVTGFLLYRNLTLKNYFQKITHRFFSLFIPYLIWQIITVIFRLLLGSRISFFEFLLQTFTFRWPVNGALWYVYVVFLYALFSPIPLLCFKNKFISWYIIFSTVIFWNARSHFSHPLLNEILSYGYISNMFAYLPAYLTGVFLGRFSSNFEDRSMIGYLLLYLFTAFALEGVIPNLLHTVTIQILPVVTLVILPAFPKISNLPIYKLTFLIYALHQPLIGCLKKPIDQFYFSYIISFAPVSIYNVLLRIVILIICVILSSIIYFICKRYSPKFLFCLTGGRS